MALPREFTPGIFAEDIRKRFRANSTSDHRRAVTREEGEKGKEGEKGEAKK